MIQILKKIPIRSAIVAFTLVICQFVIGVNNKSFEIRGFHIDLRNEVMKMSALKETALKLSKGGINTLIMEWEDTFPYENHLSISGRYCYSRNDIIEFNRYCNELGIDVIPLKQTFGHVEYILRHSRYANLRESSKDYSQVCPLEAGSTELFSELIDEVLSTSTSKYFHIGCDETRLLGVCNKCKPFVAKHGSSKLFVDYVRKMCKLVIDKGKIPVLWADIILKYPEFADELPKEAIFIDWNYGVSPRNENEIKKLQNLGFEFWGAASLRSAPDNLYITEWEKHFKNQQFYIPYAKKNSFKGMIMTSWSTSGMYSYIWDYPPNEVIHLEEIRNVYPLAGFNILLNSFFYTLEHNSINYNEFIKDYAKNHFGFNEFDTNYFLSIFLSNPYIIVDGKVQKYPKLTISSVNKEIKQLKNNLGKLKPKRNKHEFEHLILMVDMRANYLDFKEFEAEFNSTKVTKSNDVVNLFNKIIIIKKESERIGREFIKLNKNDYYLDELVHLNSVRSKKLDEHYFILKQMYESNRQAKK